MSMPPNTKKRQSPLAAGSAQSNSIDKANDNADSSRAQAGLPEYRDRRQFLIAMFMIGAVRAERVVERIATEIEAAT
jgi:hypothetical protein